MSSRSTQDARSDNPPRSALCTPRVCQFRADRTTSRIAPATTSGFSLDRKCPAPLTTRRALSDVNGARSTGQSAGGDPTIIGTIQNNRRHVDLRTQRETALHFREARLAGRAQIAVAAGVNDAVDEVRI